MKIDEGQYVRHRAKPEWGVGKVEGINGDRVYVRFAEQLKTITMPFAEKLLEPASPAEFTANKSAERAGPAVGRTAPCGVCGKDLSKSRRSADGAWKSCVNCSAQEGTEHIFYPYPDAFGATDSRASDDDPAGTQSDCVNCRAGRGALIATGRRCGSMEPTRRR